MTAFPHAARTTVSAVDKRQALAVSAMSAAAMFAFMDVARIVFPSISFVYGRAGSTPAAEMGLFALLLFATAGLLSRTAGINVAVSAPVAIAATIATRIALIAVQGGTAQLLASSLGLIAVVGLLGALAASDLPIRAAARGLALGLIASMTVHVLLGTHDSIWVGGAVGWLVTAAVAVALGWGWAQTRPNSDRPAIRSTQVWLLIGPIVALQGIAAGTPATMRAAWGEGVVLASVLLVAASAAGFLAGRFTMSSFARDFGGATVLVPALLSGVLLLGTSQPTPAAFAALLATFLCTLALTISGEAADDSLASRGRRSAAPAGGMILAFLIVFGFYASYELQIGFPRGLLPASAAVLIGAILFRSQASEIDDPRPSLEDIGTVLFAPFVVLFVVLATQSTVAPAPANASLDNLRVMTWNVHMGFDQDGRFNPERISDIISAELPDVVVLNEVDRGWLLAGGHDLMGLLADDLRMDYRFAPAADAIWGNAILSRHPIENMTVTRLDGDAPMNRSMFSAELLVGSQRLGIIGAHLHHLDDGDDIRLQQTLQIAEAAQALQLRDIPVLVLGDFNETPDSMQMVPLRDLTNLVAEAADGASTPTFPSTNPIVQIDHIFGTRGIRATDLVITQTTASDHLPVAVTIHFP